MPPQSVCTRCRQAVSRRKMLQWLGAKTCPGHMTKQVANGAMHIERPDAMTTVRVGRSDLHTSHTILHFQGIWWCARCGAYTNIADFAKSGPKLLLKQCLRAARPGGRIALQLLARGRPPRHGMHWPVRVDSGAHRGTDASAQAATAVTRVRLWGKTRMSLDELPAPTAIKRAVLATRAEEPTAPEDGQVSHIR